MNISNLKPRNNDMRSTWRFDMLPCPMEKENGSIIVVVLLVISAMTILSFLTILISSIDLDISCNERELRNNFYGAESAANEGVQRLVNARPVDLEDKKLFWHHPAAYADNKSHGFREPVFWDVDGKAPDNALQSPLDQQTFIASVERRLATGSSAVMTESRLYLNEVYGMSDNYHAIDIIEIGFYLRY